MAHGQPARAQLLVDTSGRSPHLAGVTLFSLVPSDWKSRAAGLGAFLLCAFLRPGSALADQPSKPAAGAPTAPGSHGAPGALGKTKTGQNAAQASTTSPKPGAAPMAPPAALPPTVAPTAGAGTATPMLKFSDYLGVLNDSLKLTPDEKNEIQTYYLQNGVMLRNVLNSDSLSPLQQEIEVGKIRDERNGKITARLASPMRAAQFEEIEAKYRVALVELAAAGGLIPAGALPPAAAPTQILPGQAEPSTSATIGPNK